MAYIGPVFRWEIFWADLEPSVGSEQGGERRPVLVVSNDGVHASLPVVTVLPCTKLEGKKRRVYPFEVLLPHGLVTKEHMSILIPQQIWTISKLRLLEKIGVITDAATQDTIENRLLEHLGITFEAEAAE